MRLLLVLLTLALAMPAQAQEAMVTFDDQTSDGATVTVASVHLPEGGFVTIHDETVLQGDALGSVRGTSAFLDTGSHQDITVQIEGVSEGEVRLIAMPHQDTDGDQTYTFVESQGQEDGPYTSGNGAVTDDATVTVEQDGTDTGTGGTQTDAQDTPALPFALVLLSLAVALRRR